MQGFFGGDKILKYFDLMGTALGFDVVKGTCSTALVPMTEKERQERNAALAKQAKRFLCRYYTERGWLESDYFYPTRLGFVKRSVGRVADAYFARSIAAKAAMRARLPREND